MAPQCNIRACQDLAETRRCIQIIALHTGMNKAAAMGGAAVEDAMVDRMVPVRRQTSMNVSLAIHWYPMARNCTSAKLLCSTPIVTNYQSGFRQQRPRLTPECLGDENICARADFLLLTFGRY